MKITKSLRLLVTVSVALLLILSTVRVFAQEPSGFTSPNQPPLIEFVNKIDNGENYVVTVRDNYAYAGVLGGLQVIDVSHPTQPLVLGTFPISSAMHEEIFVRGDELYPSSGGALYIVDVSNPSTPKEIGFHPTLGYSTDFALVNNIIYLSHFNAAVPPGSPQPPPSGITILDVTNPAVPTLIGSHAIEDRAISIAVKDLIAYVADINGYLHIVDISNPSLPVEIRAYHVNMMVGDIKILGNYLYAGGGLDYGGVPVFDISNPTLLKEVNSIGPLYAINHFEIKGHYAYLAGEDLYLLDVTNIANPQLIMTYNTPDHATDVDVKDNYIYIADYDNGLLILRTLQDKVSTTISDQIGGTVTSRGFSGSSTTLTFPGGAFTNTVSLTYRHLWLDQNVGDLVGIGRTFELETVYPSTNQSAQLISGQTYTITAEYTDTERGAAIENTLALYYWQGDHWAKEPSSIVYPANNIIVATPNHSSSVWAILGEARRTFLPVISK
jgi:hypothetical protein